MEASLVPLKTVSFPLPVTVNVISPPSTRVMEIVPAKPSASSQSPFAIPFTYTCSLLECLASNSNSREITLKKTDASSSN